VGPAEDARTAVGAVDGDADHLAGTAGLADVFDRIEAAVAGGTGLQEHAHARDQLGALAVVKLLPFVAFQDAVVPESGVVDVYVHLLGASLAFIVLFAYVFVITTRCCSTFLRWS
jgi:hypothetical protein